MLKHFLIPIGVFTLSVPANAAAPPGPLAKELAWAIAWTDGALAAAPIRLGVATVDEIRLPPHAKLELVNLRNGYCQDTGLRRAVAIFADAKADSNTISTYTGDAQGEY